MQLKETINGMISEDYKYMQSVTQDTDLSTVHTYYPITTIIADCDCQVEYVADNDYSEKVNQLPKKCFQYILPENGFYKFRETGCKRIWIISDQMRILRILSEIERQNILKNMNYNEKFEFEPYKKAMAKRMRRYNYGMDQL